MVNLPGLTHVISIREFRGKDPLYEKVLDLLIVNGHSFAVHGGNLYLSASATDRLMQSELVDKDSLSEEL